MGSITRLLIGAAFLTLAAEVIVHVLSAVLPAAVGIDNNGNSGSWSALSQMGPRHVYFILKLKILGSRTDSIN